MSSTRYAFATAYLKGEESKIITSEHLAHILRVSSLPDAMDIIHSTSIGVYLQERNLNRFTDVDASLWAFFQEHIRHLSGLGMLPDEMHKVLQKHIVKYDILNIKSALQSVLTGKKVTMIPVGIMDNKGELDKLTAAEDIDTIIAILKRCGLGKYADIVSEAFTDGGPKDAKDKLLLESRLDNVYHQDMLLTANGLREGSLLTKAFGCIIDLLNLQIIMRSLARGAGPEAAEYAINGGYILSVGLIRELLELKLTEIPGRMENTLYYEVVREILVNYEKTQNLIAIEEVIDRHKFRLVKDILATRIMSPLVMPWYLILREIELRNLRLIAKSLLDNIPMDGIKNLLVAPS